MNCNPDLNKQAPKVIFSRKVKKPTSLGFNTAKNTVIPPNFLVWKFCGKIQFPHSSRFCRISIPGN